MTENKAIVRLVSNRDRILFDSATGERQTLEEVKLENDDIILADEIAIRALQTVQHYRTLRK